MIIARAPLRISFGGGGTDLAAYYNRYGGMVISTSINKYVYSVITRNFDPNFQVISADYQSVINLPSDGRAAGPGELQVPRAIYDYFGKSLPVNVFLASEVPPGTGLGSSGATCVNLCMVFGLLSGEHRSAAQVAELAYMIEVERLGASVGKQDQYASAVGGLNCITFSEAGVQVAPLRLGAASMRRLERRLMLFYTGGTRRANDILERQRGATERNDPLVIERLHAIKQMAGHMKEALEADDLDAFAELLHQSWLAKRALVPGISNGLIDECYDAALAAGAQGGKIAGAGGGGFLLLYCQEAAQPAVRAALEARSLRQVHFAFEFEGARVLLHTSLSDSPFGGRS
ncbi:MAG: GHMP kinase [Chloroflexales bacterium]|nr:GHMP kinase [Chloroflexales bacterium]